MRFVFTIVLKYFSYNAENVVIFEKEDLFEPVEN